MVDEALPQVLMNTNDITGLILYTVNAAGIDVSPYGEFIQHFPARKTAKTQFTKCSAVSGGANFLVMTRAAVWTCRN